MSWELFPGSPAERTYLKREMTARAVRGSQSCRTTAPGGWAGIFDALRQRASNPRRPRQIVAMRSCGYYLLGHWGTGAVAYLF